LITTFEDGSDTHPAELATVKVYDPGGRPEIVVLVPVPVVVVPPGVLVNVQVPVAGKPFKTTLPVKITHVGCVIETGEGAAGTALTMKLPELVPVPDGVVTLIEPVAAPAGSVAVICVALFTVNEAVCPL
jgi:hypothetical protein